MMRPDAVQWHRCPWCDGRLVVRRSRYFDKREVECAEAGCGFWRDATRTELRRGFVGPLPIGALIDAVLRRVGYSRCKECGDVDHIERHWLCRGKFYCARCARVEAVA